MSTIREIIFAIQICKKDIKIQIQKKLNILKDNKLSSNVSLIFSGLSVGLYVNVYKSLERCENIPSIHLAEIEVMLEHYISLSESEEGLYRSLEKTGS